MTFPSLHVLAAVLLAMLAGGAAVVQRRSSLACWSFLAGMLVFAAGITLGDWAQKATNPEEQARWMAVGMIVSALFPVCWLSFSMTYSRGDARENLERNRWTLLVALVLPVGLAIAFWNDLYRIIRLEGDDGEWVLVSGPGARVLTVLLLAAAVGVLLNLEKTVRAAVGTARWRIKYVFLGVGLIFGVKIYVLSQDLLFSAVNLELSTTEAIALLLGTVLFAIAFLRRGFSDLDIYPSRSILQSSLTVILVGGYLFVVGGLAQVVMMLGGMSGFPAKAFLILVGIVGLAVLLLSDRLRSSVGQFVTRNFHRPEHDYRRIWTNATESLSSQLNRSGVCKAAARLISETCQALSVTIFIVDESGHALIPKATTSPDREEGERDETLGASIEDEAVLDGLRAAGEPVDLEEPDAEWAESLRELITGKFARGGDRIVVPLIAANRLVGMISLADRVNGLPYTDADRELLAAIGNHIAASLLNLRLNEELMRGKELEAFQAISTFFVHDMKNAANSLGIMLQNLPVHFDDPAFREDALRGIGKTVGHINELTERLSSFRDELELEIEEADLNALVLETLDELPIGKEVEVVKDLAALPMNKFDSRQIRTVLTNLVINAQEAVGSAGRIVIESALHNGAVHLTVRDNGCGMSPEFLQKDLFRPFRSTKSKGLGIGMFQSRMIIKAHGGSMHVESVEGEGTMFRVILPLDSLE